jgi:hypothetical protein
MNSDQRRAADHVAPLIRTSLLGTPFIRSAELQLCLKTLCGFVQSWSSALR